MLFLKKCSSFILFNFFFFAVYGQAVPSVPAFYKVTVNPYEGHDTVIWYSSPGADYYRINMVIFDNPLNPPRHDSIGYTTDTVFINRETQSGNNPVGYSVMAVNITGGIHLRSIHNVPDSTIHLKAVFDSCTRKIVFSWNDYNTWRNDISQYKIYQVVDNVASQIAVIQGPGDIYNNYSMDLNYQNDNAYFFVEAINNDGRSSVSNMANVFVRILRAPESFYAKGSAMSEEGKIKVTFAVDLNSQLSKYTVLRSDQFDGEFEEISAIQTEDKIIEYIDTEKDFRSGIFYYKLNVLDICDNVVMESDVINNIHLTGENNGISNQFTWNTVETWSSVSVSHVLYRYNSDNPGKIDSFLIPGQQNAYSDNLEGFFDSETIQGSEFCYQLKISNGTKFVISDLICLTVQPDIIMPNAFIPGNPDGINDALSPLFVFEPVEYELTIYNRWGNKIWTAKNTPWDGKQKNEYVSEGVYLYSVSAIFSGGRKVEKNGYVTVLYH